MMVTAKICDGRCRSRALDYEAEIARLRESLRQVQAVVEEFRQRSRLYAAASVEGMYPDTALAEALRANDPSLLAG